MRIPEGRFVLTPATRRRFAALELGQSVPENKNGRIFRSGRNAKLYSAKPYATRRNLAPALN